MLWFASGALVLRGIVGGLCMRMPTVGFLVSSGLSLVCVCLLPFSSSLSCCVCSLVFPLYFFSPFVLLPLFPLSSFFLYFPLTLPQHQPVTAIDEHEWPGDLNEFLLRMEARCDF